MRIIITHVYVCPQTIVLREKWHFLLLEQDRQTQVLAAVAMATTIIIE